MKNLLRSYNREEKEYHLDNKLLQTTKPKFMKTSYIKKSSGTNNIKNSIAQATNVQE